MSFSSSVEEIKTVVFRIETHIVCVVAYLEFCVSNKRIQEAYLINFDFEVNVNR